MLFRLKRLTVAAGPVYALSICNLSGAGQLRIVNYNINADTNGNVTAGAGLSTVLQGIGNESLNGVQRPLDILALQETTSNTQTVDPIVTSLNSIYGANIYARSSYQGTQSGSPTVGNGPNALVYNQTTLQLLASVGVGTPKGSTNGEYRQVIRYEFQPIGGPASGIFYVYDSHAKSGSTSTDQASRGLEATIIRNDEANLPASARVIYTGDFNLDSSTEPFYVNISASGNGQAIDPINRPGNWDLNAADKDIVSESSTDLRYRDDFQLLTQNVINDPNGLEYIAGSYHAFGNNGSLAIHGNVSSASNTALPGLPNRSAVLTALTTATDHLPVVADYTDITAPVSCQWASSTGGTAITESNWVGSLVPASAGDTATFASSPGLIASGIVTLDSNRTVGHIVFNDASASYTIAQGSAGVLTIDNSATGATGVPSITVSAGSHAITAPVTLAAGMTINLAASSSITLSTGTLTIAAGNTLSKTGAGSLTLGGPLSVTGSGTATFSATGGSTSISFDPAAKLAIATANSGTSVTFAANQSSATQAIQVRSVAAVTVGPGSMIALQPATNHANRTVLVATSVSNNGRIDVGGNDLIVHNGSLSSLTLQARSGFNIGGAIWAGNIGLTDSAAAADPTFTRAIGMRNATANETFDTVSALATTDVLVKDTYFGDADLNGSVNAADFSRLDNGFANHLTGWSNGDFNYDGSINAADYSLIDNGFGMQGASLAAAPSGSALASPSFATSGAEVPEPTGVAAAILVGAFVAARRRRVR